MKAAGYHCICLPLHLEASSVDIPDIAPWTESERYGHHLKIFVDHSLNYHEASHLWKTWTTGWSRELKILTSTGSVRKILTQSLSPMITSAWRCLDSRTFKRRANGRSDPSLRFSCSSLLQRWLYRTGSARVYRPQLSFDFDEGQYISDIMM